ncbi:MAG TPA: hypothetical protein VF193_01320 [Steroidobacter sp.]
MNNPARIADSDLESQIASAAQQLHTAPTPQERRAAWERLKQLHVMRSPERVEQMERERGLR